MIEASLVWLKLPRRLAAWLVLAVALPLAVTVAAQTQAKPSTSQQASHKLLPFDLIRLQIFNEPNLDRDLRVSQGHTIVAPLIGVVDVRNRTVRETEIMVTDLYKKDYLVNPQVNITVIEYAPRTVNVLGAVNTPGSVPIPPEHDLNLLDAIARCGGFSRMANRTRISLTRTLPDGRPENYIINAEQLMSGDSSSRWIVQDGDIISVPERML